MSFSRISAIVLRQLYLVRGSLSRLFPMFVWVGIDIVLWGFLTKYLDAVTTAGLNFVATLLGAVLFWNYMSRAMSGVTMAFFEEVWSRNFLNLFASPITVGEYLLGLVTTSLVTSTLGLLVMVALAAGIFGMSVASYGLLVIPFLLILLLFGLALGFVGVSLVLRLGPAAEWFVWPIPAVLSPFAGVFYPLSTLPDWMRIIGELLPPSHVFEGVRSIALGGTVSLSSLAAGASLAIAYLLGAAWLFVRVHRYAVRTGLIARYSAESVT